MAVHVYDNYTKSKVETFIPQARAGVTFAVLKKSELTNSLLDTTEVDRVIDETVATIDLLLAPSFLEDWDAFSDLKAKKYMNFIDSQLESVLTRAQMSIIRDYPAISIA